MIKKLPSDDIDQQIAALQSEANRLEENIRDNLNNLTDSVKPANVVKNLVNSVSASSEAKKDILNTAVSLGMSYIGNKLLWGGKAGVAKRVAGAALQIGAGTNLVKNVQVWKRFAGSLFRSSKKKKETYHPVD